MQKKIFLLSLLLSLINITYSQTEESSEDKSFENEYYNAEAYIDDGNFQEAIEIYKKLLQVNSDNSNLNFKIGYCYIHTAQEKKQAVKYLEKAVKNISNNYNPNSFKETKAPLESYFYLGKAYHYNNNFNKAIDILNEFNTKFDKCRRME